MKSLKITLLSFVAAVLVFSAIAVTPVSAQSSVPCLVLSNSLKKGMRDVYSDGPVFKLQKFLVASGYLNSNGTGYFGPATFAAAKAFQSSNGLPSTGLVGSLTRARIQALTCGGAPISSNPIIPILPPVYNPGNPISPINPGYNSVQLYSRSMRTDGGSVTVDYTINDNSVSATSYRLEGFCPSGANINVNGSAICGGGVVFSRDQRNFTAVFSNSQNVSQSASLKVRAIDSFGNSLAEDNATIVIPANIPVSRIDISNPNSTQGISRGANMTIQWSSSNVSTNVAIDLYKNGSLVSSINSSAANTGSYVWSIPTTQSLGSDYKIRITDRYQVNVYDESDSYFSIEEESAAKKSITSFTIPSISATGVIDENAKTVTVNVPYGTSITNLVPTITVGGSATISPLSGVAQNFATSKVYTVTAGNGTKQTYVVNVVIGPKSSTKAITAFNFASPATTGTINESAKTISLTVPFGTPVTALVPTIAISANSTISPASGVARNFTNPVVYTVTAQDGSAQAYTATVSFGARSSAKAITAFNLNSPATTGTINESAKTVTLSVPFGTNVTALVPSITLSSFAAITPASGVAQNFTNPVSYTVVAQDGSTQVYTVTVTKSAGSSAKAITAFSFANPTVTGVINETAKTIAVTVPFGTSLTSLTPTISISSNAGITPASGTAQSFSSPKVYTVTAQDGSTQTYTVTVSPASGSSAKAISSFTVTNQLSSVINETAKTIAVTVPFGTDITSLKPVITVSANAGVNPASGALKSFSLPQKYTVTAQDGSLQDYTITVTIAAKSSVKDITSFRFAAVNADGIINNSASPKTITVIVPKNTNVKTLVPTITTSSYTASTGVKNATVSPLSGVAKDFTNTVVYRVTAEDGTTQDYNVLVAVATN